MAHEGYVNLAHEGYVNLAHEGYVNLAHEVYLPHFTKHTGNLYGFPWDTKKTVPETQLRPFASRFLAGKGAKCQDANPFTAKAKPDTVSW